MKNKYKTKNRLKHLEYEYGETNLNSNEIVSPAFRKEINRKYYDKQNIFIVDSVLYQLEPNVQRMIKKEVYQICNNVRFKELCYNCKIEQIISIIILYVWGTRYKNLRVDQTRLWNKYKITWKRYALVLSRLLQKTRENTYIK